MGIIYMGDESQVSKELAEAQDILDEQYRKILGEENVRQLNSVSSRVLNSESFYSDRQKYSRVCGEDVYGSNKFGIASDKTFEIDNNGRLKERKIRTAPLFYISEEGFLQSGSAAVTDRRLVSYVHEFDHYVWYALQKIPFYIASLGISANLGATPELKNIDRFLSDMITKNLTARQFSEKASLASFNAVLYDSYEKANLILDNAILEPLGIQRPLSWRGKPREYALIRADKKVPGIVMPVGGDPFEGLEAGEVIKRFLNWDQYGSTTSTDPFVKNLVQSVKELKVSRVSFTDLRSIASRK